MNDFDQHFLCVDENLWLFEPAAQHLRGIGDLFHQVGQIGSLFAVAQQKVDATNDHAQVASGEIHASHESNLTAEFVTVFAQNGEMRAIEIALSSESRQLSTNGACDAPD